jgi:hypothetical protein
MATKQEFVATITPDARKRKFLITTIEEPIRLTVIEVRHEMERREDKFIAKDDRPYGNSLDEIAEALHGPFLKIGNEVVQEAIELAERLVTGEGVRPCGPDAVIIADMHIDAVVRRNPPGSDRSTTTFRFDGQSLSHQETRT